MPPNPIATEMQALTSAMSCLLSVLCRDGKLDLNDLTTTIQQTAVGHRRAGHAEMADALHRLSEFFLTTTPEPRSKP